MWPDDSDHRHNTNKYMSIVEQLFIFPWTTTTCSVHRGEHVRSASFVTNISQNNLTCYCEKSPCSLPAWFLQIWDLLTTWKNLGIDALLKAMTAVASWLCVSVCHLCCCCIEWLTQGHAWLFRVGLFSLCARRNSVLPPRFRFTTGRGGLGIFLWRERREWESVGDCKKDIRGSLRSQIMTF